MIRPVHVPLLALLLGLSTTLACSSVHDPPPRDALVCSRCEAVWMSHPDPQDIYGLTYVSERAMTCPDCRSAVANFFRTGSFEHGCETCGDALVHCTLQDR